MKKRNKINKIINKTAIVLIISLLITLPATAISINIQTQSIENNDEPIVGVLGDTILVDDDGTGDYTSIQDAINAASAGDYIIVKDGTYADQLTVNVPDLTIVAASGESPTIYVSSYDIGIDVTAPDVTIEGFEIFGNGSKTGGPFPTIRGNTGSDGLLINNNVFKVFTGELGQMALMLTSGVINVSFTGNQFFNYATDVYHTAYLESSDIYYGSIQDAINEALDIDTIQVSSGTYDERLVIDKQISLDGNGPDTILQPTNVPTPGVYDVEIDANDTIIQDFTFDFNGPTDTRSGNGIVVSDFGEPPVTGVVIQSCTIYTGDANTGIQTGKYSDVSSLHITGNIFYADNDGMGEGVYINPYSGDGFVLIENNQFYGNLYSAISIESSNVTAYNNTIDSDVITGIYGIRFIELTGGQIFNEVEISFNTILNVTYGISIGTSTDVGSDLTAEINFNTINFCDVGVRARYGANLSNSVFGNKLDNNTNYGVNNEGNNIISAISNWWGDISGPYNPIHNPSGTGVNVSENVTFWPWYEFNTGSIPPSVTYEVGQPNALFGEVITDTTEIEITAEDNESGLLSLEYRIWDSTNRWSEWITYTNPFKISGDGVKIVEYNATDNAGTHLIGTEMHRVDTTPPYVKVIYPNGGEFLRNNIDIEWEAADKIPDQKQTEWNNYFTLTEDYPGHIQSFQPTESTLKSIELLIEGEDALVSVKLFSSITPVPTQIAQSTQHLQYIGNENNPVWIDFKFDHELELDTDQTYYIGITQEIYGDKGFNWYYFNSSSYPDPYIYGNAWLRKTDQLEIYLDWDFAFRTYFWEDDIQITVQYSTTGVSPWSTIADQENNDGFYIWDTSGFPDGGNYRIRIIGEDYINELGADQSDNKFQIDNTGPLVSNIVITDTTMGSPEYTKNGDNLVITATIEGNPLIITADLSGFGKGDSVPPTSFTGTTASWLVNAILCSPSDGEIVVSVEAEDPTGDTSGNTGSIIADNTPPSIDITRPGPGIYIMDSMRLVPFSYPLIIGQITMRAEAEDGGSGIKQVEFLIDDGQQANMSEEPYEFLWDEAAFGFFTVEVIATDNVGLTDTDIMRDFFIVNFDIFGHQ